MKGAGEYHFGIAMVPSPSECLKFIKDGIRNGKDLNRNRSRCPCGCCCEHIEKREIIQSMPRKYSKTKGNEGKGKKEKNK